jgi:hypothetical protein
MTRIQRLLCLAALVGACLFSSPGAQARGDDTKGEVAALTEFHGVIFTIWHTAWPTRDVAMLRKLLPEVERRADTLRQARLPGILRDRQKAWDARVSQLLAAVREYGSASAGGDTARILDAAEKLHKDYEALVRVTRPVMKEIDEFHRVLYTLYHHDVPSGDVAKIRASVGALKERMATLEKATLGDRWKSREEAFVRARAALARSFEGLNADMAGTDAGGFAAALETMHGKYQALEKVFE